MWRGWESRHAVPVVAAANDRKTPAYITMSVSCRLRLNMSHDR